MNENELTLTEISRLLQQPQHRLIYLCEKEVIVPDGIDAKGRGSSRRFSSRNLFEFSVAFTLGEFHIPATVSKKILFTIRLFEKEIKKSIEDFQLPHSLTDSKASQISIVITKGSCLYFVLSIRGQSIKILGGIDISEPTQDMNLSATEITLDKSENLLSMLEILPKNSIHAYFTLNLTQIAQDLQVQ